MTRRRLGASYRFAAGVIRPPLMAFTRRDWRGAEHLPAEGGFVAATNHISHVDPLTVAHFLFDHDRPPRFLAKDTVFEIPLIGRIIRGAGQIPVYRESADAGLALSAAVDAVRRGECVAIYPEATLTRDPQLWPMVGKTGAARIALTTGCPVVPIAQWGPHELLAPYGRRLHVFPRKTMHIWAGPPVDLSRYAGQVGEPEALRGATDAVLDAITGLLARIRGEPVPLSRWDPRAHGQPLTGDPRRAAKRASRRPAGRRGAEPDQEDLA